MDLKNYRRYQCTGSISAHKAYVDMCKVIQYCVYMRRTKSINTVTDATCRLRTTPRSSCQHQSLVRILKCWCKTVELWPILRKSLASGSCRYVPRAQASVWLVKSTPGNCMDHIQQQQAWVTWVYQVRGGKGRGGLLWNVQAAGLMTSWEMCSQQQDTAKAQHIGLIESGTLQHVLLGTSQSTVFVVVHQVSCCLFQNQQHWVVLACRHDSSTCVMVVNVTDKRQSLSV